MVTYSYNDIVKSLKEAGLKKGDSVFVHSNLGYFGLLEGATSMDDICFAFLKAFIEIIGDEGTLIVPTFSYSFFKEEIFDYNETPSTSGTFSEYVRKDERSIRSLDPNFSVVAIGRKAREFTYNISNHPFGENSFFDRFYKSNGVICNLNFDSGSTFIHYVEKQLDVFYRYDKKFHGQILKDDKLYEDDFYHFVYSLDEPSHSPNFEKFHQCCLNNSDVLESIIGRGSVLAISAKQVFEIIETTLEQDELFLTVGSN
jgi:aminoglycoside 3-N-acetyltransferase